MSLFSQTSLTKACKQCLLISMLFLIFHKGPVSAKERTILVTGASGHLGISLIEVLLQDPEVNIRALVHQNDQRIEDLKIRPSVDASRIQTHKVDILDYASIEPSFSGVDAVFHLAAVISINSEKGELEYMRRVNLEGTNNVLEASKASGIKNFIHCSSSHAFKHLPDRPLSTDNGLVDFDELVYDASKAASQQMVTEFAKKHDDFHHVVIAPSGIIGRNDHPDTDMWPLFERYPVVRFSPITKGGYAFIDVQVLADIMRQAMNQLMDQETCDNIDGEQFLVGGHSVTVKEMVEALQDATGKSHCLNFPGHNRPIQLPLWVLRAVAPLYEAAASLLGFKALITQYSIGVLGSLPHGIAEKEYLKLKAFFNYNDVSLKQTFLDRYQVQMQDQQRLGLKDSKSVARP
ncbi:MAG: NAD-dependent epimerase/dehydratase family protein [Oligoflexales bacterium]|nr:NAD-dependent epimerase/dehydratase family protein [Oligoflexales bacterium]